jgi:phosphatidylserine/phosphatidylglycerophosphate/cardiolipin synthase-like enzyme
MRKLGLILSLGLLTNLVYSASPEAMFSPYEGEKAFNRIYNNIKSAKETAHITIYSWSDSGVTKAMESLLKHNPKIKLRVVLHRPLAKKDSTLTKVAKLESLGAMFKMAKMNMHEKFVLIDSQKFVNTSANMSGGAKKRYAEDFIFIDSEGELDNEKLIKSFEKEFSVLWNTSEDIVTEGELQKADVLELDLNTPNLAKEQDPMTLHSSSMNFNLKRNKLTSADFKKGKIVKMIKRKLENGDKPFVVSTALINAIDNAEEQILLSLNHFNLYSVSQALIRAVERGIEIKLAVDNQEFKTNIRDEGRKSIEMTPRFVRDFKKLKGNKNKEAPVRVKFYSHAPHHSSWFLNHHKYVVIDANGKSPILLAGSFNISKNAEFNQFDNYVEYKGIDYIELIQDYAANHKAIWGMNRNHKDNPNKEATSYFKKIYKNSYIRIHAQAPDNAVSLTWSEAISLKKEMGKIAPGLFRGLFQNKACTYYDFKKKTFFGGNGCK